MPCQAVALLGIMPSGCLRLSRCLAAFASSCARSVLHLFAPLTAYPPPPAVCSFNSFDFLSSPSLHARPSEAVESLLRELSVIEDAVAHVLHLEESPEGAAGAEAAVVAGDDTCVRCA